MSQPGRWVSLSKEGRPRPRYTGYDHHSGSHRLAIRLEHSAITLTKRSAGTNKSQQKGFLNEANVGYRSSLAGVLNKAQWQVKETFELLKVFHEYCSFTYLEDG